MKDKVDKIIQTMGSEGPRHDPYHYDRFNIWMKDGRHIELHLGLGEWLKLNGTEVQGDVNTKLQELIGHSISEIFEQEEENGPWGECPTCGGELTEAEGFAGEPIQYCDNKETNCKVSWSADPRPYCE